MNFFDRLDEIRKLPVAKRKAIALWSAVVLTGFVVVFWLVVHFTAGADEERDVFEDKNPLSVVKEFFSFRNK